MPEGVEGRVPYKGAPRRLSCYQLVGGIRQRHGLLRLLASIDETAHGARTLPAHQRPRAWQESHIRTTSAGHARKLRTTSTERMHERRTRRFYILDFGAQYGATHRTARARAAVLLPRSCCPHSAGPGAASARRQGHHPLTGGPYERVRRGSPDDCDPGRVRDSAVPVLGICYGMQLMIASARRHRRERRTTASTATPTISDIEERPKACCSPAWAIPSPTPVWMSHGDRVEDVAAPASRFFASDEQHAVRGGPASGDRPLYGIQFHPEVTHTERRSPTCSATSCCANLRHEGRLADGLVHRGRRWRSVAASRWATPNASILRTVRRRGLHQWVAKLLHKRAIGDRLHPHLRRQRTAPHERARSRSSDAFRRPTIDIPLALRRRDRDLLPGRSSPA